MAQSYPFAIAACAARIRQAGAEIQLMPAGVFRARDGRPHGLEGWHIDASAAERVLHQARLRQTPFVIDYEHQTLAADKSGAPAPAAGWFEQLEWREGDGLYAVGVQWTARARSMIEADEYRFISPVFGYDEDTGEVRELHMVAVTNFPAIDGIADVAAARFQTTTTHPEDRNVDEKLLELLGLTKEASDEQVREAVQALRAKADTADEANAALTAARAQPAGGGEPDPAQFVPMAVVQGLQTQVAALSSQVQGSQVEQLVRDGLDDGRLLPSMEDWARSLGQKDVAALRSYLDSAQPIAALSGTQTGGKKPDDKTPGQLSEAQLAVCRTLGIDQDEYLKQIEKE